MMGNWLAVEDTTMSAIRAGMVSVVPLTILGGLFMILANLPIAGWEQRIAKWAPLLQIPVSATFGLLGVFVFFAIGYDLGQRLKQEAAQAHLMVYDQETKQRLLNVQREREAHEAFLKEYEAHFSETRDEATARELGIVTKQAKKLETRTTFKETKASDLSGSTLRNLIERTASRVE